MADTRPYFYVSVMKDKDARLLLGPFDQEYEALKWVDVGKAECFRLDPAAIWYGYGTAKIEHCPLDGFPPEGLFNHLLAGGRRVYQPAQLENRRIPVGQERRLRLDPTRPGHECNPIVARTWRVVGRPLLYGHCVIIVPVGDDGAGMSSRMLAIRFWEEGEEIVR